MNYRVLRGGSWNSNAEYCRSAFRNSSGPSIRNNNIGFRAVRAGPLKSNVSRVLRGGSWHNKAKYCRSANRGNSVPSNRYSIIGFRVVRAVSVKPDALRGLSRVRGGSWYSNCLLYTSPSPRD